MMTVCSLAEELAGAEYGAPVSVDADGVIYRCRIEVDEDASIDNDESFGTLAFVERDRWSGRDAPRPAGFNGRARKLSTRGDAMWWQPPADVADEHLSDLASSIIDILEFGYIGIIVERCEGVDHYGDPIVVDAVSLSGIEATADDAYRAEVIDDLLEAVRRSA